MRKSVTSLFYFKSNTKTSILQGEIFQQMCNVTVLILSLIYIIISCFSCNYIMYCACTGMAKLQHNHKTLAQPTLITTVVMQEFKNTKYVLHCKNGSAGLNWLCFKAIWSFMWLPSEFCLADFIKPIISENYCKVYNWHHIYIFFCCLCK